MTKQAVRKLLLNFAKANNKTIPPNFTELEKVHNSFDPVPPPGILSINETQLIIVQMLLECWDIRRKSRVAGCVTLVERGNLVTLVVKTHIIMRHLQLAMLAIKNDEVHSCYPE